MVRSVAVAVKGSVGDGIGGGGSRRAVRWAMENLVPKADRFILVHVMPTITTVPTPSGNRIPVQDLDENVVAIYVEDMKVKFKEVFMPFKKLCKARMMETLVLEDDDPARALVRYISESGIKSLVLGSCSSSFIARKSKGAGVPTTVLRCAPHTCDVYVVSKDRIVTKSATASLTSEMGYALSMITEEACRESSTGISKHSSELSTSSIKSLGEQSFIAPSQAELSYSNSDASTHTNASLGEEEDPRSFRDDTETVTVNQLEPAAPSKPQQQLDVQTAMEQLRLELQDTIAMYKQATEELVRAQNKITLLSSEYLEEARKVTATIEREETLRKAAAKGKAKHLQAMKELEEAKALLAKESYERQIAELNALKEYLEKQRIIDQLLSSDRRYKRYTREEIELATNYFSDSNVIGEGGYGKVYKCSLDHTPVAVKVLQTDSLDKKEEFLKEVEVLSQLRHPHMVLLLGACPETGCLVYEYLENGSLQEFISQKNGKPSLPWFMRFRIVFEVACALAFLHNSKPEPIVHRDLKPGNILLDRNYVSKIGDVGLAKFISNVVPDNVTEYTDSVLAGTLYYMDPEYQRTGTLRPKSDLFAFGVITLQLLTARHPNSLLFFVEDAIQNGSFADILDKSVTDWPLAETEELARIALKCSKFRCRDRPDLDNEVLPVLKRLVEFANANVKVERNNMYAPSHYFCPILQEIMDDPHIAADGFTYELRAIKAWLEKHDLSPVTKRRLQHNLLIPNYTIRSAIQDWRSRVTFLSALIDKDG